MGGKKRGPSCLGTVMLLLAVIFVLKTAYDHIPHTDDTAGEADDEQTLYSVIYEGIKSYSTELEFDYDCTAELFDTFERVLDDHPEIFWLNGSGKSEKTISGSETKVKFVMDSNLTLVEILGFSRELEQAADKALSGMDEGMSDYEKLLWIHDYIVRNTEYDSECAAAIESGAEDSVGWKSTSVYGCLHDGIAVCSGYSAAFQLLAQRLGFECIRVSGADAESGESHEWNCVKLAEKWYYVDVTWDDPVYTGESIYFADSISHEYFMINEQMLSATHIIGEDEIVPICSDDSMYYYRRYGMYLDSYDFAKAAEIIGSQVRNSVIELAFADSIQAGKAAEELFDGYGIFEIPDVIPESGASVTYTSGRRGLIRLAFLTE